MMRAVPIAPHRGRAALPAILLSVLLGSCKLQGPHFSVLVGNYAYGRGDYQEATVQYLGALESGEYVEWVQYNLANVYHSLGEFDAAFELWNQALDTDDVDLLFAIHFNRGILYYEQGRYEDAFESFKQALIYDLKHVGLKYNLELTLLKLQGGKSGSNQRRGQQGDELSADSIRMFEYIRRKEEQQWIQENREEAPSAVSDW